MENLIPLGFGRKGHVNAITLAVEKQSIFEETDIAGYFHMAVFVEVDSYQLLVSQLFVDQDGQIRKEVHDHRRIQADSIVLGNVVPGLRLDDITELEIQTDHGLTLLLVLDRQVVLLVDLVVAVNSCLQLLVVGMRFVRFRPVIP